MRLVTFVMLRELVDLEGVDMDFVMKGFKLASEGNNERHSFLFTTVSKMEEDVKQYAIDRGWDPDTTLFLYTPPRTEEEKAEIEAQTKKAIEEDPDWDDIQIGEIDPEQIHGSLYKDMTIERLAELLIKPWSLRAFS